LTVGVYYSPEFRETVHIRLREGVRFETPIGEGSVNLLDQVLPQAFERVVRIKSPPPVEGSSPKLAAVIIPRLEVFDVWWPYTRVPLPPGPFEAKVTYRFSLYEADGTPIASWLVTGKGRYFLGACDPSDPRNPSAWPGNAFDLATQNAARKFLYGVRALPEVQRWLYRAGVGDAR
jgi:hypothetical protein